MTLSREAILAAADRPLTLANVPEWGGQVALRPLNLHERDRFEAQLLDVRKSGRGARELHLELVAMSLCDDAGVKLFESAEELSDKHPDVIQGLFHKALEVNGLYAAAVDDAEKNSAATQTASSATDSPVISA